ncbi:MAG: hypothetical protein K0U15_04600 [Proteobacteria bacterium]|nr:hypothetical protein [Pseudomonadota bacterium]MCH9758234.1 hypothetical protein [Pseudomonadota bacterium]
MKTTIKTYLISLLTALLLVATPAVAAEKNLSDAEIKSLLNGKSIAGVHYASRTLQYFSESGLTLWIKDGDAKPSEGQWKVENNSYCSNFGSDWGCYKVVLDEEQQIYYFIKEGFRAPFISLGEGAMLNISM